MTGITQLASRAARLLHTLTGATTLAALALVAAPAAAQVTVGANNGSGNCYPFSCLAGDNGGSTYQQVYTSSAFGAAPFSFNNISFYKYSGTVMDSASYQVSFYLTGNNPGALSTTAASNRGTLLGSFGNFSLSGAMPDVLSLTGATIAYTPTLGNLLMEVNITGLTFDSNYSSYFQNDSTTTTTSRYYAYNGSPTGSVGASALRTTFATAAVTGAVPEPASWGLMILGFGVVGGAMRYRRRATGVGFAA